MVKVVQEDYTTSLPRGEMGGTTTDEGNVTDNNDEAVRVLPELGIELPRPAERGNGNV